ncbi:hypothetical protein [Iningainema tapete]|uniref:Uncharacterized protein n=1 Tax=Iningainema tapete BLCC-T55 TaxID=2748662 RepID=A0A8J7BWN7_9CYAN|nr:hypothetical protein [Iningainema tapete]MBD2771258.1 hypothetical protein [Iningainema tapete BLCC-T55]
METTLASVEQPLIVNPNVEIYQPDSPEILLFDDAIQVKAQKLKREKHTTKLDNQDGQKLGKASTSAVSTDVVILQTSKDEFEYITAPLPLDDQESLNKRLGS